MVQYGMYGMLWYGMECHGVVWYVMVWYGVDMVWYGVVWHGYMGMATRESDYRRVVALDKAKCKL